MKTLKREDVLLIFTYAPAGLGHLRVTDALYDGLPKDINSVLLGADDEEITYLHRLMSINPIIRKAMEWFLEKKNSYWFYAFYIWILKVSTRHLYSQMEHLIRQQWQEKKTVVVVSTHFGLAHQIAAIKEKLQKNLKIKIILVFQVTDATSIEILYVPGADLICVPSEKVKKELLELARERGLEKAPLAVLPYPLSQSLQCKLTEEEYEQRLKQYSADSRTTIKVVMPISGAAVGMVYYEKLVSRLRRIFDRFRIYVVVRDNIHTRDFINKMAARDYVTVIDNDTDKKVVDSYEKLYSDEIIGLEVVKPSEQAFKSLFSPKQRGGTILLLTEPVGKQEKDNLKFLIEHKLLPNQADQKKLEEFTADKDVLENAANWRGIKLTNDPERDANLINWCIKAGVFDRMSGQRGKLNYDDPELASNGVQQFWEKVDGLLAGF